MPQNLSASSGHKEIIDTLIELSETARREGLLAIEPEIPSLDEFVGNGIQIIVDGFEVAIVKKVLVNTALRELLLLETQLRIIRDISQAKFDGLSDKTIDLIATSMVPESLLESNQGEIDKAIQRGKALDPSSGQLDSLAGPNDPVSKFSQFIMELHGQGLGRLRFESISEQMIKTQVCELRQTLSLKIVGLLEIQAGTPPPYIRKYLMSGPYFPDLLGHLSDEPYQSQFRPRDIEDRTKLEAIFAKLQAEVQDKSFAEFINRFDTRGIHRLLMELDNRTLAYAIANESKDIKNIVLTGMSKARAEMIQE